MDSLEGFQGEEAGGGPEQAEHDSNTDRLKELIRIKAEVEKDIESLRTNKIKEMEELLELKSSKERSRNELEELRLDVYREKNLLDSLRQQRATREAALEVNNIRFNLI
jgi:hypothetical protein